MRTLGWRIKAAWGHTRPVLELAARRVDRSYVVGPHTELVIEGYPRSGNTFAVVALQVAQGRCVRLGHHLHLPAHVLRAVHLGKPVLVLARQPKDAISSFLVREPMIPVHLAVRLYVSFYSHVLRVASAVVFATFDQVTTDFGVVIERVNRRFGTSFQGFEASPELLRECWRRIDELDSRDRKSTDPWRTVARPHPMRAREKERLASELEGRADILRAEALYRSVAALAETGDTTDVGN